LGRQKIQVQGSGYRTSHPATVKQFHRYGFVTVRIVLEGNQDPVLFPPGPGPVLIDEGKPKASVFRECEIEESLVSWEHFHFDLSEHDPVIRNDRPQADIIDSRRKEPGCFMPFDFQRELKRRLNESIGKTGRRSRKPLLQRARDALPFGWLQSGG